MSRVTEAKNLAKWLNQEHVNLDSWRSVAKVFRSPLVKAGTLNRIAKSKGKWIPKDKDILIALGLAKPRLPAPIVPEWLKIIKKKISKMAKETRESMRM